MGHIILHPTDTCQWYTLVNEAQAQTQLFLNEDTESYLVFLLMRFSKQHALMESIVALEFLESLEQAGTKQVETLQAVGDKSLLFCGLFPGIAAKRRVNLDYFTLMGQTAYSTASHHLEHPYASLFEQLSIHFIKLQHILQSLQHTNFLPPLDLPLKSIQ